MPVRQRAVTQSSPNMPRVHPFPLLLALATAALARKMSAEGMTGLKGPGIDQDNRDAWRAFAAGAPAAQGPLMISPQLAGAPSEPSGAILQPTSGRCRDRGCTGPFRRASTARMLAT